MVGDARANSAGSIMLGWQRGGWAIFDCIWTARSGQTARAEGDQASPAVYVYHLQLFDALLYYTTKMFHF